MLKSKIYLPIFIKRLLKINFRASTMIGYLITRIFGYSSCTISLIFDENELSFKLPIRSRANFRLLRGTFENGSYNYNKPYEPGLTCFIAKQLKPGSTFLDFGANRGYFSVIAGKLVGDDGFVFAFEPNPQNFKALYENVILLNKLTNVYLIPIAASDQASVISLIRPTWGLDDGTGFYMTNSKNKKAKINIPAERADRVIGSFLQPKIDMVKIDVEAAELKVLKGMKEILKKTQSLYVEVSEESKKRFNLDFSEVFDFMNNVGFNAYELNDDGELKALDGRIVAGDIVFLRE